MNLKELLPVILRVLLGSVFIFSGIAKIDSIYQFEKAIFDAGIENWSIIPYLSRFTIAFEIFLGICFFHTEGLKKFTIPATALMMIVFCVHLGITIAKTGGTEGNCGCFGEKVPMTPISSLIKNIVTLGLLFALYKLPNYKPTREFYIPATLGALAISFMFFFMPVKNYGTFTESEKKINLEVKKADLMTDSINKEVNKQMAIVEEDIQKVINESNITEEKIKSERAKIVAPEKVEIKKEPVKPARVTSKFAPYKNFSDGIATNLDEGKKLICMYNTGCDHCMENAKKICALKKKTKIPEVYILFWGEESETAKFFEYAGCTFPYKILEPQVFFPLIGKDNFPKVHYLHEGNIMGEWAGDDFAPEKLQEALKK